MSDLQRTIDLIFNGVDNVSGTLGSVEGGLDKIGGSMEKIGQPFQDLSKVIIGLDSALAAIVTGGLALAYNKSVEYESAVVSLTKVMGEQPDIIAKAQDSAMDLSIAYGESASAILLSTADFKQAGYDVIESMQLSKNGLDLVIAGDLEAAEASDLLVASLKGFNAPASEAGRLIDILNEVSNNYATNVEELAKGMSGVSPIAKLMGLSMEETAGIITPVIEVFRSGDEAAVALKTGLLKLVDDSDPVEEALTKLGVAQRDANGHLRSGKDILMDVSKAFQTADEKDKLFLTSQLVGIDQSARMVTVFDNLSKSTEITATAMGAAGSAAKEVETKLASSEVVVKRFKTGFDNLGIAIGYEFKTATTGVVAGATDIEIALQNLVKTDAFKPIFDALNSFGIDFENTLRTIAKNLPAAMEEIDFSKFIASLDNLTSAFGGIFDYIDLKTPEGLAAAIQKTIDAVTALINVTTGMVEGFTPFVNILQTAVEWFSKLSPEAQQASGNIIGFAGALGAVGGILSTGGEVIGGVKDFVDNLSSLKEMTQPGGALHAGMQVLQQDFTTLSKYQQIGAIAISFSVGWTIGGIIRDNFDIDPIIQEGIRQIDKVINFTGQMGEVDLGFDREQTIDLKANLVEVDKSLTDFFEKIDNAEISVRADLKLNDAVTDFFGDLDSYEKNYNAVLKFNVDPDSVSNATKTFEKVGTRADGNPIYAEITAKTKDVDKAKKEIESLPTEKLLEIKLQGEIDTEIARIKAEAELTGSYFEWNAKVNIAEIEAGAEVAKQAFESIGESVSALSDSTSSMFSSLTSAWDNLDIGAQMDFQSILEDQQAAQLKALESQIKLNDAQAEYLRKKADAISSGRGLIQVDMTGAEPEIQAVMWKVIKNMQMQASKDAAELLLGV